MSDELVCPDCRKPLAKSKFGRGYICPEGHGFTEKAAVEKQPPPTDEKP